MPKARSSNPGHLVAEVTALPNVAQLLTLLWTKSREASNR